MEKGISRRDFLKISALGGAGLIATGCNKDPIEKLMPLMEPPYDYVPGISIFFATTCQECSAACGMVVKTREGRAIKVEGNPSHPVSEGKICLQGHSTLQALYSPSRVPGPIGTIYGEKHSITWKQGIEQLCHKLQVFRKKAMGILYIGPARSGSFSSMVKQWIESLGGGTYLQLDLTPVHSLKTANRIVFGKHEIPHFALNNAEVLINFGADFLETWLNPVQLTKAYTRMHSFREHTKEKKGTYVHIAPHMTMTGTNADRWIPCPLGSEAWVALGLSHILLPQAMHLPDNEKQGLRRLLDPFSPERVRHNTGIDPNTLKHLAEQFSRRGRSLAMAGGNCNATTEATLLQIAVNVLNYVAGNIGSTIVFGADYQIGGDSMSRLEAAVAGMQRGEYNLVIIENVNPAFILPEDLGFRDALQSVPHVVSLSTEMDETSQLADLHLPTSHFLESWGDARPRKGVFGIQQPAMAQVPGYNTRQLGDLLLELARKVGLEGFDCLTYRDYIQSSWKALYEHMEVSIPFEQFWKDSLRNGGYYRDFTPSVVSLSDRVFDVDFSKLQKGKINALRLIAANSTLHNANAKGSNRSWLYEIPHPVTQVVWDSWVEVHPDAALGLGIHHGDLVEIVTSAGRAEVPAYVYYGIEKNTVALPAGMGRELFFPNYVTSRGKSRLVPVLEGKVGLKKIKVGINAMELLALRKDHLSGDFVFAGQPVVIKPTGKKADMVTMDGQYHKDIAGIHRNDGTKFGDRSQKGRGLVQVMTLNGDGTIHNLSTRPQSPRKYFYTLTREDKVSFYDPLDENVKKAAKKSQGPTPKYYKQYKWAMIIDLDRCTGCSACVAACYAENNIPVVGKDRCALGREMSWIRIERYFEHNQQTGRLETYYTPQMCQQCENAGCEPVCPVFATYHTPDGLNAMIYNRCVGTRFCANNCIFGMRRFNWRSYLFPFPLNYQLNPSVSVRVKGIMEKCTFCEHRIKEAKDLAKDKNRQIKDGEVQTACQQACPANAIIFGNLMDEHSEVRRRKEKTERGYIQLEEFNYQPSITYLKKVNHEGQKA